MHETDEQYDKTINEFLLYAFEIYRIKIYVCGYTTTIFVVTLAHSTSVCMNMWLFCGHLLLVCVIGTLIHSIKKQSTQKWMNFSKWQKRREKKRDYFSFFYFVHWIPLSICMRYSYGMLDNNISINYSFCIVNLSVKLFCGENSMALIAMSLVPFAHLQLTHRFTMMMISTEQAIKTSEITEIQLKSIYKISSFGSMNGYQDKFLLKTKTNSGRPVFSAWCR